MTEPLDPKKYHVITPKVKLISAIVAGACVLFVLPFISKEYYRVALNRPSQSGKEVNTVIKKGEGINEIAARFQDEGAINSAFLFNLYIYMNNLGNKIQAGTYKIPAGSNLMEVVEIIQHGTDDARITFLEGWRVEEFARLASSLLENIDYQRFVDLAKGREGYLFPDTYYVNRDIQEEGLLDILKSNFDSRTVDVLTPEKLEKAGLTKEQAVIFASMLEREIHMPSERPIVAGILIKRWKEGMKLDVDATTQYVTAWKYLCGNYVPCYPNFEKVENFEWWPQSLSQEDLDSDSPYNTRKVAGLPPAPICSPSLGSVEAVVNFKDSPYYFYLTDSEGAVHYAETLEQHNANVQKYLR